MQPHKEIVEFLIQQDNLGPALAIGEAIGKVKNELARRFWSATERKLEERLGESALAQDKWQVRCTMDDLENNALQGGKGVQIEPQRQKSEQALVIGVWYDPDLCIGAGFKSEYDWQSDPAGLTPRYEYLTSHSPLHKGRIKWYLAWERAEISLVSDDTRLRLAEAADSVAEQVLGPLQDVLESEKLAAELEAADDALAKL
mgnify:CR=1 FL=1